MASINESNTYETNKSTTGGAIQPKKFAICYHGMTRSTRFVYQSHIENIFNIITENNSTYDVYLHTWRSNYNIVWDKKIPIPNDYTEHLFLNPKGYQIDEQDVFLRSINFNDYYYPNTREWIPELIRNYLCALESQKRCFTMCKDSNIKYDYVIFVRPDTLIKNKIPYNYILQSPSPFSLNSIFIPNDGWFEGYNDRFAIVKFDMAHYYAYRINELKYYRRNVNFIVAERYLKYIVDKYYKLEPIEFKFDLIRSM